MEIHSFLLQIAAIILTARVFAELAAWMGAPPIVGELCAGIVLGPSLLGWIEPNAVINLLAELGIILLLFEVGLETDIGRLVRSGGKAAAVAVAGPVAECMGHVGRIAHDADMRATIRKSSDVRRFKPKQSAT